MSRADCPNKYRSAYCRRGHLRTNSTTYTRSDGKYECRLCRSITERRRYNELEMPMKATPEFIKLKEKIESSKEFTPEERELILDCFNLGDYTGKHEYPKNFEPKSNRWARRAWAVLDQMNPDALKVRDRFMLGGLIAGALSEMYEVGRRGLAP